MAVRTGQGLELNRYEISHSEFSGNLARGGTEANAALNVPSLHGGAISISNLILSNSSWEIHNVTFLNIQVRGERSTTVAGGALFIDASQSTNRIEISNSRLIENSAIGGDSNLDAQVGARVAHGGHGSGGAIAVTDGKTSILQPTQALWIVGSEIVSN